MKKGLTGKVYEVTVLPSSMDELIDEIYKRNVPIEDAKEMANWLLDEAIKLGRRPDGLVSTDPSRYGKPVIHKVQ
jgi:hypothetical protein